ncbi:ABC-F family ATP-binding cassette domain-containing protein [Maritimibacter sp. DP1N21-5]|uniref:ABC-F family ATP-binding cassette domain-containing protein n=1 Tax=Maritimibacter sp. DP1N21-5 TaxID=2836867 RepID=UPI001C487542|nr:ATP-binding cassette domain-containing protein [Maritimibacter sp. DP1N21-5]MBV7410901.1 ATP-binding cassette domain-containing protein [Maritimibacter sp. DP1N21-5]
MSAFLTLTNLSLSTPDDRLLCPDLTLTFARERTGIVGQNGTGKSTLLALLGGDHPSMARSGTVGTLVQDWPDHEVLVADALGIADPLAMLARIDAGQGSGADFDAADWSLPSRVEAALDRVGLPPDTRDRRLADLSGGQIVRLGLARLLLDAPDLILLDEPTNNLDAEGRMLVAELIDTWPGGVVVASHDRVLLENMDRIVELTPKGAFVHGGGWSVYAEERAARRARDTAALSEATRDVARTRRAIRDREEKKARRDRQGRAARARGDQPKMMLDKAKERSEATSGKDARLNDKLEDAANRARSLAADRIIAARDLRIDMDHAEAHGLILNARDITATRGGFKLGPLSLAIAAGEHVALSGPNGSGKSTLIAALGDAAKGSIARLDQHVSLLDPDTSILANLRAHHPALDDNAAHATLARFAFRNSDADRIVATLSGGEKLRAGLAVILGAPTPPVLVILDEPTNHLDLEAVEQLERALSDYAGALLVVSHDVAFLEAVGIDRTIRLEAGQTCD